MNHVIVQMHIQAAAFAEQLVEQRGGFVEPLQIRIEPTAPCVAVGFLLDDAWFLEQRDVRISAYIVRWRGAD